MTKKLTPEKLEEIRAELEAARNEVGGLGTACGARWAFHYGPDLLAHIDALEADLQAEREAREEAERECVAWADLAKKENRRLPVDDKKRLWVRGTEEAIRVVHQAFADLAANKEALALAGRALRGLHDEATLTGQPPLYTREREWDETVATARAVLAHPLVQAAVGGSG